MKINVESDGTYQGTKVALEDGTPVEFVGAMDIELRATHIPVARVTFLMPKMHIRGAQVTVSEEHLLELADAHGFTLHRANGEKV